MGEVVDLKFIMTFTTETLFIYLAFMILLIIGLMMVYKKCNKPAWAAIVPIYNIWVLFEIVGIKPWLSLIPIVNLVMIIYAIYKLGAKFNKSILFSLGLVFLSPIFLIILGFESKNKEEIKLKPDLMVKDPASSDEVNLMEADPISSIPNAPIMKKEPVIKEMPSLEEQMVIPKLVEQQETQPKEPVVVNAVENHSNPNAFEMRLPKLKEEVFNTAESNFNKVEDTQIEHLEITEAPVIQEEIIKRPNLHKTQKFCPECGSPNDMLNKFCISCGYDFDKVN